MTSPIKSPLLERLENAGLTTQAEPKAKPVTAADIRAAMLAKWCGPEWAVMWEVAPGTGNVAGRIRYADAVMMSLWPSRGLELHGVEIKVSRSDWKREAADPTKAERIAAYCERWWVHTSPGVIQDVSELPPAWGWRVYDGKRWVTMREADKTDAKPCDRQFLASLMRRSDEAQRAQIRQQADATREAEQEALIKAKDEIEERITRGVAARTRAFETMQEQVKEFEAATGLTLGSMYGGSQAREIGDLVNAIMKSGVAQMYGGLGRLINDMRQQADKLQACVDEIGLPLPAPPPPSPDMFKRRGRA